jgi:hypothetical protein
MLPWQIHQVGIIAGSLRYRFLNRSSAHHRPDGIGHRVVGETFKRGNECPQERWAMRVANGPAFSLAAAIMIFSARSSTFVVHCRLAQPTCIPECLPGNAGHRQ